MAAFIYRCPVTGRNAQGWTADAPLPRDEKATFCAPVTCPACRQVHHVNPDTSKSSTAVAATTDVSLMCQPSGLVADHLKSPRSAENTPIDARPHVDQQHMSAPTA